MVSINRELTFLPVGSLSEDQAHRNVYEGVGRWGNVPLIFNLLLPYLICFLPSRFKGREFL